MSFNESLQFLCAWVDANAYDSEGEPLEEVEAALEKVRHGIHQVQGREKIDPSNYPAWVRAEHEDPNANWEHNAFIYDGEEPEG